MRRAPPSELLTALPLDGAWLTHLESVAERLGLAMPPARLAAELRALSDAYNGGDFARSRTRGALAARLLFSFARDVPKMGGAVRELIATGALGMPASTDEGQRPLRVLDVGAGLGASTWGLARALAAAGQTGELHATLVDDDTGALDVAHAIAAGRPREGGIGMRFDIERAGATSSPSRSHARPHAHAHAQAHAQAHAYDVILLGQVLSEMGGDDAAHAAMLRRLLEGSLAEHGSLVVVEPALRERTRALHRVRDLAVAASAGAGAGAGAVTVFAPCLHAAPCPALGDADAWCHEDLPVDLPPELVALARAAGLRWQGLTFAYLVLRKDGRTLHDAAARNAAEGAGAVRVVSSPIDTKGKRELFLCGDFAPNAAPNMPDSAPNGLVPLRRKVARLDRDGATKRSEPDAWRDARRGDILLCEPALAADAARARKETTISRERE